MDDFNPALDYHYNAKYDHFRNVKSPSNVMLNATLFNIIHTPNTINAINLFPASPKEFGLAIFDDCVQETKKLTIGWDVPIYESYFEEKLIEFVFKCCMNIAKVLNGTSEDINVYYRLLPAITALTEVENAPPQITKYKYWLKNYRFFHGFLLTLETLKIKSYKELGLYCGHFVNFHELFNDPIMEILMFSYTSSFVG